MTDLSDLTPSDLRRGLRHLIWKHDRMHRAARWLLAICCIEAVAILWLLFA
jgi:hypothetical protein